MTISRKKLVAIFIVSATVFMFASNTLFGTAPQVFTNPPEPFLGTPPPEGWRSVGYTVFLPIKMVLVGPMLFTGDFLREDPPPPFVGVVFALYWSVLAVILHYVSGKVKQFRAYF